MANGAFLHFYNAMGGPDSACMNLPASGWKATGDPVAPVFRYSDGVSANGPCRSVLVKNGKLLRVACAGRVQPLSYSLDETTQGAIGFRFGSGAVAYCGEFGGIVTRDEPGMFSARTSPDVCPPAPVSCP